MNLAFFAPAYVDHLQWALIDRRNAGPTKPHNQRQRRKRERRARSHRGRRRK